jgi:hypothetical protein
MENPDQKKYSSEAMLVLTSAIARDEEAFEWLMQNDYKELAALVEVLLYQKQSPLNWLTENHFNHVASFVGALNKDAEAIDYLLLNHGKQWAATADLVNGNREAQDWLMQFFPDFVKLADALIDNTWPVGSHTRYYPGLW